MVPMKTDMTGAAVVLAVLRPAPSWRTGVRVTGLCRWPRTASGPRLPAVDVITQYGGRTVEVRNTDAEGRLVLADALAYADERLDPDVADRRRHADRRGDPGLGPWPRGALRHATTGWPRRSPAPGSPAANGSGGCRWSRTTGRCIDSDVADLCHIATTKAVGAGSVVAALFLREFTGGRRWAHLDIAGPGRSERDQGLLNRGGTGFGARLLLSWLHTLR